MLVSDRRAQAVEKALQGKFKGRRGASRLSWTPSGQNRAAADNRTQKVGRATDRVKCLLQLLRHPSPPTPKKPPVNCGTEQTATAQEPIIGLQRGNLLATYTLGRKDILTKLLDERLARLPPWLGRESAALS